MGLIKLKNPNALNIWILKYLVSKKMGLETV